MSRLQLRVSRLMFIAIGLATLMAGSVLAAVPYSEDWSAGDLNGWSGSTTSTTVVRDATVGNPAGSLAVRRELLAPIFDIGATSGLPAISGDYTGAEAWMISFDVYYDIGNYTDAWLRFRYQDATFNGWRFDVADVFPSSWQSYSVMFDPSWSDAQASANGWVQEIAPTVSWQQLMTNVDHPEIRLLLGDQLSALAHIDNFVLKAVPEPTAVSLAFGGLLGFALCGRRPLMRRN